MKRDELIERLMCFPKDMDVVVETLDDEFWFTPVGDVELSDVHWKDGEKIMCTTKCIVIKPL